MPDFKLVISDPSSTSSKVENVKVKVSDKVQAQSGEKEGKNLPIAKMNEKIKQSLNADMFVTLEIIKQEGDKLSKIKTHFRIEVDSMVPDNEIWISQEASEKYGASEFEAKAYRTKAFQLTIDQNKSSLIGRKIGDVVELGTLGVPLKLKITGGSDNSGFPMRPDVGGGVKKRLLISGPPGYHPEEDGERRRKTVRGNMVVQELVQVNAIILR
ncbi:30S ribosomal protein S6e [Sulfuracidifex metallicus]|uniref:Small ribosomal subunit protein eS6 n=1 Tax=Sulfuracidifex metallicus DSM 6482 = JCM 9184 TaxID=523847 RepID=A0A6A9QH04_SULME|nr:30S ribosomal protein S6e [Sulfuracidifex metallicus]MUN28296.1 30S ribosomal protein S6e [Sulfuracidifex metallicus DSM 6482 = JCM 9184]WOE51173.1 30S ribosomal protein S6e [Sulfuracidifex metallicus DSM 6482 = JCM 9184]